MSADDRQAQRRSGSYKPRSDNYLFMVLIAVVLGFAGAAGAIAFRILIRLFQGAFFGGVEGVTEVFQAGLFADPHDPLERARGLAAHWRVMIPALGGLIVGPMVYFLVREAKGPGIPEVMEAVAFRGGVIRRRVIALKTLASSITIGSGGSGGIFAPSLFLGATTGGFLGGFIHQVFPEATGTSGAYALVAMEALVAASTHAPITAIIMIFEMTQTIEIIPPLMTACVISTLVTTYFARDSIYTQKLRRRGVDLAKDEDPNILKSLFVRDIVDRNPEVVPASASFPTVMELIVESSHSEFFVENARGEFVGAIYLRQVRRLMKEQEALRRDLVGGVSNQITIGGTERRVDLGGDYVLEERAAPRRFEGRTLAELDLRKRGGIQVLLIRSRGGKRAIRVPGPDDRIQAGDHLVLAGPSKTVDNLERL